MDYKKRYNKLVEDIKTLQKANPSDKVIQNWINENLPELHYESEAEKTERILHSISDKMSFHLDDIFTEEEFQYFDTWSNAWLEKQGQQEIVDKINPKFHEGDWIISNTANEDYRICKITNINNGNYTIESIYGYKGYNHFNVFEESYRLWTIQDVKDGDILVDKYNDIGIFRNLKDIYWYAYIDLGCDGILRAPILGCVHEQIDVRPATKKERDLLFTKMKEEGYEWNTKKKELKKIEQTYLIEGTFVNVDEVREDFMQEVYRVLDGDPTNDRANQIIDAFDRLPAYQKNAKD